MRTPGLSRLSYCTSCVSAYGVHNDHSDDRDSRADDIPVYACQVDVHRHEHADEDEYDAEGFELVFHGVSFHVGFPVDNSYYTPIAGGHNFGVSFFPHIISTRRYTYA